MKEHFANALRHAEQVDDLLNQIERKFGVFVMLAVETGSRMRGLSAPGSDYAVRFVYMPPLEWYTSLNRKTARDVIDHRTLDAAGIALPKNIDLVGFELTKFLNLVIASNRGMLETLAAGFVYRSTIMTGDLTQFLNMPHNYLALYFQYQRHAKASRAVIREDGAATVKDWLELTVAALGAEITKTNQVPPVEFSTMIYLASPPKEVANAMRALAASKTAGNAGKNYQPPVALLDWLNETFGSAKVRPNPDPTCQDALREAAEKVIAHAVNLYYYADCK